MTPIPAQGYAAAARYFFLGVKALLGGSADLAPACAFLAAQSTECLLKSVLSKNGFSEDQLKSLRSEDQLRSLRHDLEALWAKAASLEVGLAAEPPMWCVILNQTHNAPYHLRYPTKINAFQTPEVAPMQADFERLLKVLT